MSHQINCKYFITFLGTNVIVGRTAKDKKVKAVVSSLDKDLMQLVEDPGTTIMNTMTHQIFNEEKVFEKFAHLVLIFRGEDGAGGVEEFAAGLEHLRHGSQCGGK